MSVLDITLNIAVFRNVEYSFIAIALKPIQTQSGSTSWGPIYGPSRTVWYLNSVQTNGACLIELLEVELFDHLTV